MSFSPHDGLPPELEDVGRLVREGRRQPDPLELDALKQRVLHRAERTASSSSLAPKGSLLASRLLMTLLIAFGIFLSGTGATLAMQGNAVNASQSSSDGQYVTNNDDDDNDDGGKKNDDDDEDDDNGDEPPSIGVAPSSTGGGQSPSGDEPDLAVAPTSASGGKPRPAVAGEGDEPRVQAARQQAETGGEPELPFTGLAAVPILLAGVAMLASGLVLRIRQRR